MKRMNIEFAELLQTTTGKLLDTIVTREFNLGKTFPIIKSAKVENVEVKDNGLEVSKNRISDDRNGQNGESKQQAVRDKSDEESG